MNPLGLSGPSVQTDHHQPSSHGTRRRHHFRIKGADQTLEVPPGEYYVNTKERLRRRMVAANLTAECRRVDACVEFATMGFRQELAIQMTAKGTRPLSPSDIARETGLSKQRVRRALDEWEDAGLGERRSDDGGPLRKGHVLLYSWASPRPPKTKNSSRARHSPLNFPTTWEPLAAFAKRRKFVFPDGEIAARGYLEEGEKIARALQEAEEVAARFLEKVGAQPKSAALYKEERKERKDGSSSSSSVLPEPERPPEPETTTTSAPTLEPEREPERPPEPEPERPPEPETTTTTTAPATAEAETEPEPEDLSEIRSALRDHGTPDPAFERLLWKAARARDPRISREELCRLIHEKSRRYDGRGMRYFLTAVVNALPLDREESRHGRAAPPPGAPVGEVNLQDEIAWRERFVSQAPDHPDSGRLRQEIRSLRQQLQ